MHCPIHFASKIIICSALVLLEYIMQQKLSAMADLIDKIYLRYKSQINEQLSSLIVKFDEIVGSNIIHATLPRSSLFAQNTGYRNIAIIIKIFCLEINLAKHGKGFYFENILRAMLLPNRQTFLFFTLNYKFGQNFIVSFIFQKQCLAF